MAEPGGDRGALGDVRVDGGRYVTRFSLRDGVTVLDDAGEAVLGYDGRLVDMVRAAAGDGLPLSTPEGRPVCRLRQGSVAERLGGNVFRVVDDEDDREVGTFEFGRSPVAHRLKIREPDDDALVLEVASRSPLRALLRESPLARAFPPGYDVLTPRERRVGSVEVASLTGTYEATLQLDDGAPDEPLALLVPYVLLADVR